MLGGCGVLPRKHGKGPQRVNRLRPPGCPRCGAAHGPLNLRLLFPRELFIGERHTIRITRSNSPGSTLRGLNRPVSEIRAMTLTQRILISLGILLVDFVFFFVPLTALFLAYIVLFNPPWFRDFLYGAGEGKG